MANDVKEFINSQQYQQLSREDQTLYLQRFVASSAEERANVLRSLSSAAEEPGTALPEQVNRPSAFERAASARPAAMQELTSLPSYGKAVAIGQAGQMLRGVPVVPQAARIAQELSPSAEDIGQKYGKAAGATARAAGDVVQEATRTITPREAVATGIGMAVPMAAGGLARHLGAGPGLQAATDVAANLGAAYTNEKLGLEKPGAVGYAAAAGGPLAVRGAGAALGRSKAVQLTREAGEQTAADMAAVDAKNAAARTAYENKIRAAESITRDENLTARQKTDAINQSRRESYLLELQARENTATAHKNALQQAQGATAIPWGGTRANPGKDIRAAYELVKEAGDPRLPWENVRKVAKEVIEEARGTLTIGQDDRLLKTARDLLALGQEPAEISSVTLNPATGKPYSLVVGGTDPLFSEVQPKIGGNGLSGLIHSYRARGGSAGAGMGNEYRLARKLQDAVHDAMGTAGDTNAALKKATALSRLNFALQDVEDIFNPSVRGSAVVPTHDGKLEIKPALALRKLMILKGNPGFVKAFPPKSLAAMEKELEVLQRLEPLGNRRIHQKPMEEYPEPSISAAEQRMRNTPPPMREQYGAPVEPELPKQNTAKEAVRAAAHGAWTGGLIGGAVSGRGGDIMAGASGASLGAGIGAAGGAFSVITSRVISQALLSRHGRPFLRKLMGKDLVISPEALGLINTTLRTSVDMPKEED